MQKFIIHIFLTNSNEQATFEKLLQLLPSYGFKNFVISQNNNKKFQLPTGVYFFQDDLNKNQLFEKIKTIFNAFNFSGGFLITESKTSTWSNLPELV